MNFAPKFKLDFEGKEKYFGGQFLLFSKAVNPASCFTMGKGNSKLKNDKLSKLTAETYCEYF